MSVILCQFEIKYTRTFLLSSSNLTLTDPHDTNLIANVELKTLASMCLQS